MELAYVCRPAQHRVLRGGSAFSSHLKSSSSRWFVKQGHTHRANVLSQRHQAALAVVAVGADSTTPSKSARALPTGPAILAPAAELPATTEKDVPPRLLAFLFPPASSAMEWASSEAGSRRTASCSRV